MSLFVLFLFNLLLYSHVSICLISVNIEMEPVLASVSKNNFNFSQMFKSAICMPATSLWVARDNAGNTLKSNLYISVLFNLDRKAICTPMFRPERC